MNRSSGERVAAPELAAWLLSHGRASATTAELARTLGVPSDQVRRRLHAPAQRGEWVRPAHGLWIPVPPEYRTWGAPPGIEVVDILMRHVGVGYYVGWLSAAEIHGASHQAPQVFQVATSQHVRSRTVGRTRFQFLSRGAVAQIPTIDRQTRSGHARVSTREATMLDVASDVLVAGGIDNVATSIIELAEDGVDLEVLAELSMLFPVAAGRRVGWILDEFTSRDDLTPLREAANRRAVSDSLLDSSGPTVGATDARWGVRVNRDVQEES